MLAVRLAQCVDTTRKHLVALQLSINTPLISRQLENSAIAELLLQKRETALIWPLHFLELLYYYA